MEKGTMEKDTACRSSRIVGRRTSAVVSSSAGEAKTNGKGHTRQRRRMATLEWKRAPESGRKRATKGREKCCPRKPAGRERQDRSKKMNGKGHTE